MMTFKKLASALTVSGLALTASLAHAQTVTISGVGGNTTIQGEIIDYDGESYTLRTVMGDLIVEAHKSICEGEGCPSILSEQTALRIAGSGTVTEHLIPQLANAYFGDISADMKRTDEKGKVTEFEIDRLNDSDLMITLVHSNSDKGVQDLVEGDLHAAFTTRPVSEVEREAAIKQGLGELRTESTESVIAYDGLLVVTHPSNPIQAMAERDIARVFSGEIKNWAAFDHADGRINVYMREADSNSRDLLQQVLMAPHRKTLAPNVIVLNSDAEIAEAVRNDSNAIGLTSFVHRAGVNALDIEGVCGIRVPPTRFSIKAAEYPLSRPVYFYHNAKIAHDGLRGFADFVSSAEAQSVITQSGFVDREIMSEPLNRQGLRVTHAVMGAEADANMASTREMLKLMSYSERLSTTIRFGGGSTDLDTTDYEDLEQLAQLMKSDEYEKSKFYFMGFSDSVGRADLNLMVALQRAEIVRQALVSRYPELGRRIVARSMGYGEVSPLACNETRPGREVNRRVEVWVQKPMALAAK